jgi:hypothetical protein
LLIRHFEGVEKLCIGSCCNDTLDKRQGRLAEEEKGKIIFLPIPQKTRIWKRLMRRKLTLDIIDVKKGVGEKRLNGLILHGCHLKRQAIVFLEGINKKFQFVMYYTAVNRNTRENMAATVFLKIAAQKRTRFKRENGVG